MRKTDPFLVKAAKGLTAFIMLPVLFVILFIHSILYWVFGIPTESPPWLRAIADWVEPVGFEDE